MILSNYFEKYYHFSEVICNSYCDFITAILCIDPSELPTQECSFYTRQFLFWLDLPFSS